MPHEVNVLALIKGKESYVFVYDDISRPLLIDTFRDNAADPELSLSWFDAAVLTEKARQQALTAGVPAARSRLPGAAGCGLDGQAGGLEEA